MSSNPRNCRGRLMYKPNQPHFFKIILNDSIRERKLALPKKFVRNYGNDLSNWVMLKVPTGEKWEVSILKIDGQIWLQDGWHEFVEYYSIVLGSLLVFWFDHTSCCFDVTIFDCTTTEIDYPYSSINGETEAHQVPKVENLATTEKSLSRKRKENSSLSFRPRKQTNVTSPKEIKENGSLFVKKRAVNRILSSTLEEKQKAVDRASSIVQSKNPTFQVKIQPSYVGFKCHVCIQAIFAREYMKRKVGDVILHVFGGRTWHVNYCTKISSGKRRTCIQCCGWKKFAQENDLQLGDICTFELIDPDRTTFRVVISRNTTIRNQGSVELIPKTWPSFPHNPQAIKAAEMFNSSNPFFIVVIRPSHLETSSSGHVPKNFIKNLEQMTKNAKLKVGKRYWCVKLIVYPQYGVGKLTAGWTDFVKGNCLKVEDECCFELIDSQNLLFKMDW